MCHGQLVHDNAADLCAGMALIDLQLNFVASIGLATEDCPFEEREKCGKMRLLATLVKVFEQSQDIFIGQKAILNALDSEVEEARQALLSYNGCDFSAVQTTQLVQEQIAQASTQQLCHFRQCSTCLLLRLTFGVAIFAEIRDVSVSDFITDRFELCKRGGKAL